MKDLALLIRNIPLIRHSDTPPIVGNTEPGSISDLRVFVKRGIGRRGKNIQEVERRAIYGNQKDAVCNRFRGTVV